MAASLSTCMADVRPLVLATVDPIDSHRYILKWDGSSFPEGVSKDHGHVRTTRRLG